MRKPSPRSFLAPVMMAIVASACSSSSMAPAGAGSGGGPAVSTASGGAPGTGGIQGTGGMTGSGSGGSSSSSGGGPSASSGGTTGSGGGSGGGPSGGQGAVVGGGGNGAPGGGALTFLAASPNGAILTGVRDVASPLPTQALKLHNGGAAPATVTALTIAGPNAGAFQLMGGVPALPAMLAAGADLSLTLQVATTGAALPAAPAQNSGGTLLVATLTATSGAVSARTNVYGLLLTTLTHEPTLGQILTTLGYKLNVGLAQNNANPNTGTVQQLPKVEAGTDEIAAPVFVKAPGAQSVTLVPLARFSPKGPMPFGWYPMGASTMRHMVATMASMPDGQTSDKARTMLPPITGSTSFDPGTATFGIWVYSDQLSGLYDVNNVTTNGDYDYSEDAFNSPANVHRTKVYPLKDAAGVAVPGSYLLAVEEAGNGDYQDYVFVLSNVQPR